MQHAVDKIVAVGGERILLTERGTTFGYRRPRWWTCAVS
jgi:3-deoxy-D-manno-octulosonic acid (KDO) 8-phosphate synthase